MYMGSRRIIAGGGEGGGAGRKSRGELTPAGNFYTFKPLLGPGMFVGDYVKGNW